MHAMFAVSHCYVLFPMVTYTALNVRRSNANIQWRTCLIIDGAASGGTKTRHDVTFPLLPKHLGKDVYIFLHDLSKGKHCLYCRPADFSY
jgi:hypothetical protein